MKPIIFPATVAGTVWALWVGLVLYDSCIAPGADPIYGCSNTVQLGATFAAVGAGLAAAAAGLVRLMLQRSLRFASRTPDCVAGLLSGLSLVLVFSALLHWEVDIGAIGGMVLTWLLAAFAISGASLFAVKRLQTSRGQKSQECKMGDAL